MFLLIIGINPFTWGLFPENNIWLRQQFYYEGLCKATAGISKAAFSDYQLPYFLKLYPIRFLILKLTLPLAGEGWRGGSRACAMPD